jgi:hypothetical protein
MLNVGQRDPAMIERQSQFLIGGGKTTLDAAALEKQTFHFLHITSRLLAGGGIARASIRPEALSNLEDAVDPESTDTPPLEFLEGKMDIALGFPEGASPFCGRTRQSPAAAFGVTRRACAGV